MTPREMADGADQLLKNPVFRAAMADVRAGLMAKIEKSDPEDVDVHHQAALMLQLCRKLETQLAQYKTQIEVDNAEQRQKSFMERLRRTV